MIDLGFLRHLDRFSLIVQNKVNSNYAGERRSIAAGSGLVLKDYVQYTPGDDFRRIDWRVFARTDKLYSKRFEEERNLSIHIVIDGSASMDFGRGVTKFEYAAMIGIGFAYIALKNNERFVISTFTEKLEMFKPKKGRKQLVAIVDYLNSHKCGGTTDLAKVMSTYHKKMITSRSLIVIVSDFMYEVSQIRDTVQRFRDHDVRIIQVLDPLERRMNLEGDFKFVDSETGLKVRSFISRLFRKNYISRLGEHNAKIQEVLDEFGGHFYSATTSDSIFDTFFNILR